MINTGDSAIVSKFNLYFIELTLAIGVVLIGYTILFGFNYVGLTSTAGALTLLPPAINYGIYLCAFLVGSAEYNLQLPSVIAPLGLLHLLAFIHGLFYILSGTWKVFSLCVSKSIVCDTMSTVIYTIGLILAIAVSFGGYLTLMAVWGLARSYWNRQLYRKADALTYDDITSDGIAPASTSSSSTTTTTDATVNSKSQLKKRESTSTR